MMFARHYRKHLSAYAHGELSPGEAARLAAHLDACAACRAEFEEIKLGIRLAETLPSVKAPANLWDGVEAALVKEERRKGQSASRLQTLFPSRRRSLTVAFATLLVALVAGGAWLYLRSQRPWWEVARVEGAPRVSSSLINDRGRLR